MSRYINVQTGTAIEVSSTIIAPQWEKVTEGGSELCDLEGADISLLGAVEEVTKGGSKLCDSKRHNCNREKSDGGGADVCGDSDSDSIV